MIRVTCVQGSDEWKLARLGIPTASNFKSILTPKTLKPSESRFKYAHRLIAERILRRPQDDESSGYASRGQEMETKAREYYEFVKGVTVERVGFIMTDDRKAGASPDGLVLTDGLLELKCPSAAVHIGYLLDDEGLDYRCQLQGQLWVAERDWVDIESYNPDLPDLIRRVGRDETFIRALASAVSSLNEYIEKSMDKLARDGFIELPGEPVIEGEASAA
jgi:hypothetical protein